MTKQKKVLEIIRRLSPLWPNPHSELFHSNPFELLIATMLSAQTTDKIVNTVTPALFATYKTPENYAQAQQEDIFQLIRKVNFAGTKSRNIKKMAEILVQQFNSRVPQSMQQLITLPGVGRKTANVVLGDAFHSPEGIVVDTHVKRLSLWLGLTSQHDPEKIESDLMAIVPRSEWVNFSHYLILYGRYKCTARMDPSSCPILTDLFNL